MPFYDVEVWVTREQKWVVRVEAANMDEALDKAEAEEDVMYADPAGAAEENHDAVAHTALLADCE